MPNGDNRETEMTRAQKIQKVLKDLREKTASVEGTALIDMDGLPMGSELPHGIPEEKIAARASSILGMGEQAVHELEKGKLNRVLVEGEKGYMFIVGVENRDAVLVVIASKDAKIGLVFFEAKDAANKIKGILSETIAR